MNGKDRLPRLSLALDYHFSRLPSLSLLEGNMKRGQTREDPVDVIPVFEAAERCACSSMKKNSGGPW